MGEVSADTRRKVEERDGGCVARGQLPGKCWGHLDIDHVVGRGSGGTPDGDYFDSPAWTILLCRRHNGDKDQTDARSLARDLGLKYDRFSFYRPERAIVHYPDGVWYVLNDDGTKSVYEAPWLTEPLIEERA